ncbi:MAG: hypothetical protein K6E43_05085 [Lachnospiraceae bacterium]|nr:hypothetical protein [Lachnospiraceae bacterium]
MKRIDIEPEKLNKILSIACLITGIGSMLLICYWYIGLILAIVSILSGAYAWRQFGKNKLIVAGIVCSIVYISFFIIIGAAMGLYYSIIGLGR